MSGVTGTRGIPTPGCLAVVRNRSGIVTNVVPSPVAAEGILHLVTIGFADRDGARTESLIWELEPGARLLPSAGLPQVHDSQPMSPGVFSAMVRATRWSALRPYVDPDEEKGPLPRLPLSSPLHGAIEAEDYQMVPLLKAMGMPRVQLLLADDVGLGKTVEAGLIIAELILQRRIGRILILTPASLRIQWQKELKEKFSLDFALIDRPRTLALRRDLGMDANPWRAHPFAIASYHYLKQPDVLDEFMSTCRRPEGSPHLPWDLLIADESHNLAPAAFGRDSELSRMLRVIAPQFEHRIFATATPHNGRTRCFSGLLEILDPARFSQTSEFTAAERARVREVVVRRLKSDINAVTSPPRFADRHLRAVRLALSPQERSLGAAFADFRAAVIAQVKGCGRADRIAGAFAVEILGKRLLSCPFAFADSWYRTVAGLETRFEMTAEDVRAAESAVRSESEDDAETESRIAVATSAIGAWLKPFAGAIRAEIDALTRALSAIGMRSPRDIPRPDTRYAALVALIRDRLQDGGQWRPNERLVVFTEFKTTLDYLVARLKADFPGEGRILQLFGSGEMDERERRAVTAAFNDPEHPVKILVATDAASEGLNLQMTARYLMHFDVPWNPARLEQRNGRIDRYGQSRDVEVSHFASDDDADIDFLAYIVAKVHQIREDLGATGELFDMAVQRRLIENLEDTVVRRELDGELSRGRHRPDLSADSSSSSKDVSGGQLGRQLSALREELDLDPDSLRMTLQSAIAPADPSKLCPEKRAGLWQLQPPVPPQWREVIDSELRLPSNGNTLGALPALAFDPAAFVRAIDGRAVFRPPPDAALMHLWHPVISHSLAHFVRLRHPGTGAAASRWTAGTAAEIPAGTDALVLLTLEELAVNELRETFHHWVRTIALPVKSGRLGERLPHRPAGQWHAPENAANPPALTARARDIWADVERDVADFVETHRASLEEQVAQQLVADREASERREQERFQSRQGELSKLITDARMDRLDRELEILRSEQAQGSLFTDDPWWVRLEESAEAKEQELHRLRTHIADLRGQLAKERDRVMNLLVPRRHTLLGSVQCLPVAVEIRLRA